MLPTARQLQYATAVARMGSFSQAARECGVTQPGLSAQIAELEGTLGVKLFERNAQRVLVTPAGEQILQIANRVLGGLDEIVACAKGHADPLMGTIRLGVIPTIAPYFLPNTVPRLRQGLPNLRLLLREGTTGELLARLERGQLDILLVALESDLGDVETMTVMIDPFYAAVPHTHRFATRKRLKTSELLGEEVLLLDDSHCLREQTSSICDTAGARELGDFRATSLGTLIQMVDNGVGVTLLPSIAVRGAEFHQTSIALVPFSKPVPARTIVLAWRRGSLHRTSYETLAKTFAAAARDASPQQGM